MVDPLNHLSLKEVHDEVLIQFNSAENLLVRIKNKISDLVAVGFKAIHSFLVSVRALDNEASKVQRELCNLATHLVIVSTPGSVVVGGGVGALISKVGLLLIGVSTAEALEKWALSKKINNKHFKIGEASRKMREKSFFHLSKLRGK